MKTALDIRLRAGNVAYTLNYNHKLTETQRSKLRDELCNLQQQLGAIGVDRAAGTEVSPKGRKVR